MRIVWLLSIILPVAFMSRRQRQPGWGMADATGQVGSADNHHPRPKKMASRKPLAANMPAGTPGWLEDEGIKLRFLLRDHDGKYTIRFDKFFQRIIDDSCPVGKTGRVIKTAIRCPAQNETF